MHVSQNYRVFFLRCVTITKMAHITVVVGGVDRRVDAYERKSTNERTIQRQDMIMHNAFLHSQLAIPTVQLVMIEYETCRLYRLIIGSLADGTSFFLIFTVRRC